MTTPTEWVDAFLADLDRTHDIDRVVDVAPGFDARGILDILGDRRLGPHVIHAMSDLMRPDGSMYYDAIYGAFHGQVGIRNWLVPTMAEISFIEFVPQQPTEVFDGQGRTSSIDEWQMWATMDGERIPLPRGVSVRHYEDGWIVWNADVYDTGAFRTPPSDEQAAPALPEPPDTAWEASPPQAPVLSDAAARWIDTRTAGSGTARPGLSHGDIHAITHHPVHGADMDLVADLMHPTDSVYLDPLFGDFAGQDDIRGWLTDVMPKAGNLRFDTIGPTLFNGSCSVQEWVQMAVGPDGQATPMMRGTSVRRYTDGWITYAADYFDTAVLADPSVQEAGRTSGATLTAADVARYRG